MKRFAFIFSVLVVASPAWAQIAETHSGSSSMYTFGGQEAWDTLSDFGTCYATRNRTSALELVATRAGSVEEAQVYKRLFRPQNQSCLSLASEMRVPHTMVRGAIAEGLYRKAVPVPSGLVVAAAPTKDQVKNFSDAALCYAAAHRGEVQALIAGTRAGTKASDAAAMAAFDQMKTCFPSTARKAIQIDTFMIRYRLAEALWRLGVTPGEAR